MPILLRPAVDYFDRLMNDMIGLPQKKLREMIADAKKVGHRKIFDVQDKKPVLYPPEVALSYKKHMDFERFEAEKSRARRCLESMDAMVGYSLDLLPVEQRTQHGMCPLGLPWGETTKDTRRLLTFP